MAYYYLAAQLPALAYNQGAPMTSEAFRELALTQLSAADAALLDYCTLDPASGPEDPYTGPLPAVDPAFIDKWRGWERALRLNLARFRSLKVKREGALPDAPDYPTGAVAAAKAAVAMDSPLEAELFLDKARWDAIEAFQGIQYFSRNTIYGYLLKLRLLERRALFKAEEGFTEYKGLYTAILAASGR
ncbi:MAG: hypothetical protein LBQ35_09155 [Spirochaetaceae bacterium]|nr:hypothetical protein [Spirochaetaceae bacterium]